MEYTVTIGSLGAVIRIDYQIISIKMQATAWGVSKQSNMLIYDYLLSDIDGKDLKKY